MKPPCTHKTYRDFSQDVQGKRSGAGGRGRAEHYLLWVCSSCDKQGRWADGWTYFGNIECRECSLASIERVLCPECAPKQMQPGEQSRAKDGGNARAGNARGSGGRPAAQESATGKTALRAGARKTAQPPGSSPISHEAVPTPAQHAGRGGAVPKDWWPCTCVKRYRSGDMAAIRLHAPTVERCRRCGATRLCGAQFMPIGESYTVTCTRPATHPVGHHAAPPAEEARA